MRNLEDQEPRTVSGGLRDSRLVRAGRRLSSPLHLDLGGGHRDAVFVAGSGRGGTSWLAEMILRLDGGYRYVFEPFLPDRVPLSRPFGYRRYVRPGDLHPELRDGASRILSGGTRGPWTDRFSRRFVARRRLVKEIRANLFLGWLAASFPEMPIILLLRHPCAVALSRTRLGWRARLEEFTAQPDLVEDFLSPMLDGMRLSTEFERHVFAWCVENLVPLTQLGRGQAHLVFYENLCQNLEEELQGVFEYLGSGPVKIPPDALRSPSTQSRKDSAVISGEDRIQGWQKELDEDQTRIAARILASFGLDAIYEDSPMPDTRAAWRLLEGAP